MKYKNKAPANEPIAVAIKAAMKPKFPIETLNPVKRRINSDGIGRITTSIPINNAAPNRPIWSIKLTANSSTL